jgi:hypothetical protein
MHLSVAGIESLAASSSLATNCGMNRSIGSQICHEMGLIKSILREDTGSKPGSGKSLQFRSPPCRLALTLSWTLRLTVHAPLCAGSMALG